MKNIIFILSAIFLFNFVEAQNLKKAFKYISEKDFDRAKVLLDELTIDPSNCSFACYGTALIYSDEAYRAKDLYRAFDAIIKAEESIGNADTEQWAKLSDFIENKDAIGKLRQRIDLLLFQQVKADNSITSSERFIKEAPKSAYLEAVKALYATQRFQQTLEFKTIMAYEDYLKEFPSAIEVQQAWQKIYTLAYQQVVKSDKIADYQLFVDKYPNSPQVEIAKNKIVEKEFEMVLLTATDDAFDRFITKYPSSPQSKELRIRQMQMNYEQARLLNTVDVYNNFLKKFPESDHIQEVTLIRDSLAFIQTSTINTPAAYKDFIKRYPNAIQVKKVMELQKDLAYSKAEIAVLKAKEKIVRNSIQKIDYYKVTPTDSSKKVLVKYCEYDKFGNSIKEWEKFEVGSESIISRVFSADGTKLLSEEKRVDGSLRYHSSFYYSQSDLLDSVRKICYQSCEDGLPSGNFLFLYSYFPDRNLKEILIKGDNYVKQSVYIIGNQKLISTENIIITQADKVSEFKVSYQYDFYDQLIQKTTYGPENTISSVETYFYNKANDISKFSAYDALGKIRKSFNYSPLGFLVSIEVEFPNVSADNHQLICNYVFSN